MCDNHDNSVLTLLTWNINGWYENTKSIRANIISGINPDIAIICETHLKDESKINIDEIFHAIPHNRKVTHLRAKKNYGGVCMLINKSMDRCFTYNTIDKEHDGILAVKFTDKVSKYCFLIVAMYLPPEQSTWGRDASGFFAHVLKIVYENSYCDSIILAGDTNSKIGTVQDFIPEVDVGVCSRKILDRSKNKHGQEMLSFLSEAAMCVCNGRVTPEFDNYTFIHTRGKSVIDYVAVPFDFIKQCIEFKVNTARDMVNQYCNIKETGIDLSKIIPDHSILTLKFSTSAHTEIKKHSQEANNTFKNHVDDLKIQETYDQSHIYFRRYNVKSIPQDFLATDSSRSELLELIENIEQSRKIQEDIDSIYSKFCDIYYNEMATWLNSKNVHPSAHKRFKRCTKPFWNANLSKLWKVLCEKEKVFLQSKDTNRRIKQQDFYNAQKNFDREYRKAERNFRKSKIAEIENFSTSDPNKFWNSIKNLGPHKKNDIPMEVYDVEGNVVTDLEKVLYKWKDEFETLYNYQPEPGQFDDTFYNECMLHLYTNNERNSSTDNDYFHELDEEINLAEVQRVIKNVKNNKAVGIDNLPYELFKNNKSDEVLCLLFNKFFDTSLTPSIWNLAILKPIPKNSLTDPRLPLEYRGVSLLSTVYKLFTSVLNNRLVDTAEQNNLYANEQNGFRRNRSCEDHLFTLTSIIRNRKKEKLSTYVAFVDFEKAFDRVNRNLLFYKLKTMGIGGKVLSMIQTIYSDCKSCINVNGYLTEEFSSKFGVRQGDSLSPTLFGLYINDLAKDLKNTGLGVKLSDELTIASLLYADDLAIMAESEENLQCMLNVLENWCKRWRMRVNVNKTKIIHFRTTTQQQSTYNFHLNGNTIEYVDKYKYLGIIVDEHLDFNTTASVLAGSAGRALGSLCTKFHHLKGLGFKTFTTLYYSGVTPILDYCSSIWGSQKLEHIDTIQNRAIRFYLGVHKYAPNLAINGDVGWISSRARRKVEMLRYWNRIMKMDADCLTKKVFEWDYANKRHSGSWNSDICKLFTGIQKTQIYDHKEMIDLDEVKEHLYELDRKEWKTQVKNVSKLRTYCIFKEEYNTESYVYSVYNRAHRSILSQLRCGILPIRIETGRYTNIPVEFRLCILCDENAIEDEKHFMFECKFYEFLRNDYYDKLRQYYHDIDVMDYNSKFKCIMNANVVKFTAEFAYNCYCKRRDFIYR